MNTRELRRMAIRARRTPRKVIAHRVITMAASAPATYELSASVPIMLFDSLTVEYKGLVWSY